MQARIKNPAMLIPEAMGPLQALAALIRNSPVPQKTIGLCHLRASQINGCAVCLDLHRRHMKGDETEERLFALPAWRDAPFFTDSERAALGLTESLTRLSESEDRVPDAVWNEAARHFDERELASLVIAITTINTFNRINVATRQVAGAQPWEK
ncbi:carboxymuconolactone decarboxylase family protein [Labilithrix luteola]|nr:carboxymuconolactone decarboxylase family protein [Labilithrix luteola]